MIQNNTERLQATKQHVLSYCRAIDLADEHELSSVLRQYCSEDYLWRGLHPFHEQHGADAVVNQFWKPLRLAFTALQRRVDVFFAGHNATPTRDIHDAQRPLVNEEQATWTCQMGHFMGLSLIHI